MARFEAICSVTCSQAKRHMIQFLDDNAGIEEKVSYFNLVQVSRLANHGWSFSPVIEKIISIS